MQASTRRRQAQGPSPNVPRAGKTAPHAVRIIAGQWKRSLLAVADLPGLRPTPDRVRETVFNWLSHQFGGGLEMCRVLDAFAGTGALGFEAASRGAQTVVLVEAQAPALTALKRSTEKLQARQITILAGDAAAVLARLHDQSASFDVIFLDPPFHEAMIERIVPVAVPLLSPHGLLYVEREAPLAQEFLDQHDLDVVRADKAGQVFYHLLRRKTRG